MPNKSRSKLIDTCQIHVVFWFANALAMHYALVRGGAMNSRRWVWSVLSPRCQAWLQLLFLVFPCPASYSSQLVGALCFILFPGCCECLGLLHTVHSKCAVRVYAVMARVQYYRSSAIQRKILQVPSICLNIL